MPTYNFEIKAHWKAKSITRHEDTDKAVTYVIAGSAREAIDFYLDWQAAPGAITIDEVRRLDEVVVAPGTQTELPNAREDSDADQDRVG